MANLPGTDTVSHGSGECAPPGTEVLEFELNDPQVDGSIERRVMGSRQIIKSTDTVRVYRAELSTTLNESAGGAIGNSWWKSAVAEAVAPTVSPDTGGPERIGPFRVERFLGAGNFGRVYLAKDEKLDRWVALKVPRAERLAAGLDRDRFVREARFAAQVKHPGIVTVFQVDHDDQFSCYVVLEFIDGVPLGALIHKNRLPTTQAAEILALAADAVSYAHEKGLVHRDLKPANILIDHHGRPHIADFGLAVHESDRWPNKGEVAGTPAYMSPEQVRGESHRLDGRTDIWALGVILYRMITGHPPFQGSCDAEIFDEIIGREPIPPRQRDRTVPRELERICLKCLAKRMTDRYATAADLVDDLRNWLAADGLPNPSAAEPTRLWTEQAVDSEVDSGSSTAESSLTEPVRIRPRGLRAFDFDDRDYFLKLLPGPRDRDGLPESLRFWKVRIEPDGGKTPFIVGLLCGPSGSGKTSMVRAGLLCRLTPSVIPVYVEASASATEGQLGDALRRIAPAFASSLSLAELIAAFRAGSLSPSGRKVLIVIDQFEQWLHAHPESEAAGVELIEALRQCDSLHIQCLLLVRDEFAMAAARFMRSLEIRLVESQNFATVDLFDPEHSRKVLRAFGVAYKRFDANDSGPHERFIDEAVTELSKDGKVAPVRLALFAQMLKDKPWTTATLREVGGLEGIGFTFLEDSLAGSRANPEHRLHLAAARRVLKTLLPEGASDIKGHMRSYAELLEASGYNRKPGDFDVLLEILGTELRLITPTDPFRSNLPCDSGAIGDTARFYQITHDFLVPSLRDWLTRKERETIRGRMAQGLAERTAEWTARRSRRYLPNFWEWLGIELFTQRSRWSVPEKRLMRAATTYHVGRLAVLVTILLTLSLTVRDRVLNAGARTAVRELQTEDPLNVPSLIQGLDHLRPWADPLLHATIADRSSPPRDQVRARLALLPVEPSQAEPLIKPLLEGDPSDFLLILESLSRFASRSLLTDRLRAFVLTEQESPSRRFRASVALAGLTEESQVTSDPALMATSRVTAHHLIDELLAHPDRYNVWLKATRPILALLRRDLETLFRDPNGSEAARSMAASILGHHASHDVATLVRLLIDATPRQFPIILGELAREKTMAITSLRPVIQPPPIAPVSVADRNELASRQANAAIALFQLGEPALIWPLLEHRPDPLVRTYLIDRLARLGADPAQLLEQLEVEKQESVRIALLLILGGIPADQRSTSWYARAGSRVASVYRDDPSPGVHAAAEWVLRQWQLDRPAVVATESTSPVEKRWYMTRNGHTMALIPSSTSFRMGRSETERVSDKDEAPHESRIPRGYYMSSHEVSAAQYLQFRREVSTARFPDANPDRFPNDYSSDPEGPINIVFWLDAIAYCRWLSERDGIPEEEMCYPKLDQIKFGMTPNPNYLSRTGYRLPTEAEWEYAARAGAVTSRYFGDDDGMLSRYGWFVMNSGGRAHRNGLLLPNEFGLFDMLGNLREWCYDSYQVHLNDGVDDENMSAIDGTRPRVARGGSYSDGSKVVRVANRYFNEPAEAMFAMGFRIARTAPKSRSR